MKRWLPLVLIAVLCPSWAAAADKAQSDPAAQHWVSTWATSQLTITMPPRPPGPGHNGTPPPAEPPKQASPATPPAATAPPPRRNPIEEAKIPPKLENQTVRMIGRVSVGGKRVRIQLSNRIGADPVEVGAVHIAIHKGNGAIVEGTDRALTFGGSAAFTIPPGALVVSDPVDLELPALGEFAVSLYLPHDTGAPTNHFLGLHTGYISQGNTTASVSMPDASNTFAYVWLSGVDVLAPADAFTVVAFGDSITDGFSTTRDTDRPWPSLLARRLQANKATQNVGVVNAGISGNQVLRDGAGQSALARLDRDVLVVPGAKWVILLEGINDINLRGKQDGPGAVTAEELIWGYRQIIERCHMHHIKVIGATIMPEEGVPTASERGEAIRQTVNHWIRTKGNFDVVLDFDVVTRDPQRPIHINPAYDPGDHIHPNDAGNEAMAGAVDLSWFTN